jgi:hypothetical protein
MSKLDQPLKLKHGLAAAVAIMAVSITGTAIAGGGGGGGGFIYRSDAHQINANTQASESVRCPAGTHVVGGGTSGTAGFESGSGQMVNSSHPFDGGDGNNQPDDGWTGRVDNFQNAGNEFIAVHAICK